MRKTKKEEMKKEISIIGVGDIMLGSNYPSEEIQTFYKMLKGF